MRRSFSKTNFIFILILAIGIGVYFFTLNTAPIKGELSGPYHVSYVIDGDTIVVDMEDSTHVRLIGVDTPEVGQPYADEATAFTKTLVLNKEVYLSFDNEKTDKYHRTLAYVFLSDGETMLNYELISHGWAVPLAIEPNTLNADVFERAFYNARRERIGLN